jgi:hypothetical protein
MMEMYIEIDSFNAFDPYRPFSAHSSHVGNIIENVSDIRLSKKGLFSEIIGVLESH